MFRVWNETEVWTWWIKCLQVSIVIASVSSFTIVREELEWNNSLKSTDNSSTLFWNHHCHLSSSHTIPLLVSKQQRQWNDLNFSKESTCSTGDVGLAPGLGTSPGEGKGYPIQYPGLENSMDCISTESQSWTWLWLSLSTVMAWWGCKCWPGNGHRLQVINAFYSWFLNFQNLIYFAKVWAFGVNKYRILVIKY